MRLVTVSAGLLLGALLPTAAAQVAWTGDYATSFGSDQWDDRISVGLQSVSNWTTFALPTATTPVQFTDSASIFTVGLQTPMTVQSVLFTGATPYTLNEGNFVFGGTGTLRIADGELTHSGTAWHNLDCEVELLGGSALGVATWTVSDPNGAVLVLRDLEDVGTSLRLEKRGDGILAIGGRYQMDGPLVVVEGTLACASLGALEDANVSLESAATLLFDTDGRVGSLSGLGAVDLGPHTMTVGGSNSSTTFGGSITGTGGVRKVGTGEWTINSVSHSYSGGLTVNDGRVHVPADGPGPAVPSGVTVGINGEFAGDCSVVGSIVCDGILRPSEVGGAGGMFATGQVTLSPTATFLVEFANVGLTPYGQLSAGGDVFLAGDIVVQNLSNAQAYTSYTVVVSSGLVMGRFANGSNLQRIATGPQLAAYVSYTPDRARVETAWLQDVDRNATVNLTDLSRVVSELGSVGSGLNVPGDVDGDGTVDTIDVMLLGDRYGQTF